MLWKACDSSAPRLQSVREAVTSWLDSADLEADGLFLEYAPKIARQAGLDVTQSDEDFVQVWEGVVMDAYVNQTRNMNAWSEIHYW